MSTFQKLLIALFKAVATCIAVPLAIYFSAKFGGPLMNSSSGLQIMASVGAWLLIVSMYAIPLAGIVLAVFASTQIFKSGNSILWLILINLVPILGPLTYYYFDGPLKTGTDPNRKSFWKRHLILGPIITLGLFLNVFGLVYLRDFVGPRLLKSVAGKSSQPATYGAHKRSP